MRACSRVTPNLHAVKESSGDIRRFTAIRARWATGCRFSSAFDDLIVEGVAAGASAGSPAWSTRCPKNPFCSSSTPRRAGRQKPGALYEWFLPLLRLDTVPKFVQLIKLVQEEVGLGSERVRPPRLQIIGDEREAAFEIIRTALRTRATLGAPSPASPSPRPRDLAGSSRTRGSPFRRTC